MSRPIERPALLSPFLALYAWVARVAAARRPWLDIIDCIIQLRLPWLHRVYHPLTLYISRYIAPVDLTPNHTGAQWRHTNRLTLYILSAITCARGVAVRGRGLEQSPSHPMPLSPQTEPTRK